MSSAVSFRKQQAVDPQAFVSAAEAGDVESLKALLAAGVDVNAAAGYGKTALIAASAKGHADIVRRLLDAGADVNASKADGFTALISAVFFGHEKVVRTLLAHGADVSAADQIGSTAQRWASSRGLLEIERLLKEAKNPTPRPDRPREWPLEAKPANAEKAPPAPRRLKRARPVAARPEPKEAQETAVVEDDPAELTKVRVGRKLAVAPKEPEQRNPIRLNVEAAGENHTPPPPPAVATETVVPAATEPADKRFALNFTLRQLVVIALLSGLVGGLAACIAGWMVLNADPAPAAGSAVVESNLLSEQSPAPAIIGQSMPEAEPAAPRPALVAASDSASDEPAGTRAAKRKPETKTAQQPRVVGEQGRIEPPARRGQRPEAQAAKPQEKAHGPRRSVEAAREAPVGAAPRTVSPPKFVSSAPSVAPATTTTQPPPASAPAKKVIRWP
ncbi:MAG: ankyrin repeat domain-containing protein [Pyrinomonadaceae bacterium]